MFKKALQIDSSYFPNYRNLRFVHVDSAENKETIRYLELLKVKEKEARP